MWGEDEDEDEEERAAYMRAASQIYEEGTLSLCPSDPPLAWIETLCLVTPQILHLAQEGRKEEQMLVQIFQNEVLPGVILEKGHTCSHKMFRRCLRRLCVLHVNTQGEGKDHQHTHPPSSQSPSSLLCPWEHLHLRLEDTTGRPRILDCGLLQLDQSRLLSPSSLHDIITHLAPSAAAAREKHTQTSVIMKELEAWCLHPTGLGLKGLRKEVGVSVEEMCGCLRRLLALPVEGKTRRGLRGVEVVVGRGYGVGREGEVRVPWDWAMSGRG